ncbi:MAG: hypothetical protein LBJ08_04915, partial [Bifidobacteriaceae bacterium]|nr:hypothetical protein [Bifidobacteriaceae bacterium]
MSGKKGNSADEGVRIDGGAGGTIASIDDLQRLVGLVSAAVHDLDAACKGANQLVSWSGNQIRRSETESANVTEARTAVIKAAA